MAHTLEDKDWHLLLRRIEGGKCTPFLGAGACYPTLPLGSEIARRWAEQYQYPLADTGNLARVAQFLAVKYDPMYPKEEILKQFFRDVDPPDFREADEPHGVLADLPLPVYLTTNYDDFLVRALKDRGKAPRRELCCWNKYVKGQQSVSEIETDFEPSEDNPLVFHLHGHDEVSESLVLAEGDYLDFLVNVSRDATMLPPRIQRALAGASPLFIGYALEDWSFRVLYQGLINATDPSLRRISVTVQLPLPQEQQKYLDDYFHSKDVSVYWGTAREFAAELGRRWKEFSNGR